MSKKLVRNTLTLAVIAAFAVYFVLNLDKFSLLTRVNPFLLVVIAMLNLMAMASNGLFTKFVMQPFGKNISIKESVYVSLISSIGNYFAPAGGGFVFRAAYLKRVHGFNYKDYVATLYGNYILVFAINSFFGLLALFLLRGTSSPAFFTLVIIFSGLFLVCICLSLIKIPTRLLDYDMHNRYVGKLARTMLEILKGWNQIVRNKRLLLKLSMLISFNFFVALLVAFCEIRALGLSISFEALLLFSVLGSLSLFVSITPANLGVKEVIYLFSAAVIGFTAPQILSIALLDRGVLFVTLLILWLASANSKSLNTVRSKSTADITDH